MKVNPISIIAYSLISAGVIFSQEKTPSPPLLKSKIIYYKWNLEVMSLPI